MRTFSFRFLCVAVLGLPLLLPSPARSQGQPFVGVDEGQVFDLDFDHGRFLQTLPFDVWFFVQFDSAGAPSASGRLAEKATLNCNQANFSDDRSLDLGISSTAAVNGQGKLLIPVPALPPNRSYCFKFIRRASPTPEQRAAFQRELTQALNSLQRTDLFTLQQPDAYNNFRLKLIRQLEAAAAPAELDVPKDSYFNKRIPLEQVSQDYRSQFNIILRSLAAPLNTLKDFQDKFGPEGSVALGALAARINDFQKELDKAKQQSATLRTTFQNLPPEAIQLPQRTPRELDLIALGLDPGAPATISFGQIRSAEELRPLQGRLEKTRAAVDSLQKVFSSLVNSPLVNSTLAEEAGLQGPAEQDKIKGIVAAAVDASSKLLASSLTLEDVASTLQQRNQDPGGLVSDFLRALQNALATVAIAQGSTLAPFEIRAGWYIGMDAGIGVASEVTHKSSAVNDIFTYVGTNVYFRPVNKKAHLRPLRDYPASQRRDEILKRFAITFGVPTDPLDTPSELSGVIQNNPLILGGGYRLSDSFRTALGALVFKEKDSNPTINKERFSVVPFLSFSIDFNVRGLLSRLGGAFTGANPGMASPSPGPAVQEIPKQ